MKEMDLWIDLDRDIFFLWNFFSSFFISFFFHPFENSIQASNGRNARKKKFNQIALFLSLPPFLFLFFLSLKSNFDFISISRVKMEGRWMKLRRRMEEKENNWKRKRRRRRKKEIIMIWIEFECTGTKGDIEINRIIWMKDPFVIPSYSFFLFLSFSLSYSLFSLFSFIQIPSLW